MKFIHKLNHQKKECSACYQLKPFKIKTPTEFFLCIDMIKELIAHDRFETVSSNFQLEYPKTLEGYWKEDVMYYSIQCKSCRQVYSCVCDTYHGNGSFGKEN